MVTFCVQKTYFFQFFCYAKTSYQSQTMIKSMIKVHSKVILTILEVHKKVQSKYSATNFVTWSMFGCLECFKTHNF